MSQSKTIDEFERERGLMFVGDIDTSKVVSEEEFNEMLATQTFNGCDHEFREQWLEENGYEITRENKLNPHLPSQPIDTVLEVQDGSHGQSAPEIGENDG